MDLLPVFLPLPPAPVLAFTGAGGKSSLIARLAQEIAGAGRWVVLTTTTHIWPPGPGQAEALVIEPEPRARQARLAQVLADPRGGRVVVAAGRTEDGKLLGVPPEEVTSHRSQAAAILVEADGARGRGVKAPAGHEPVLPAMADCVVVVCAADVVGQLVSPAVVHRPEQVLALTGLAIGDSLTPEAIAKVLTHPEGGLRGIPAGTPGLAFVNRVEDEPSFTAGRSIAHHILGRPGLRRVVLGAAQAADPVVEVHERVAAVVLAAGAASRFGRLKQVLPWAGSTLVHHVASIAGAAQVQRVLVIVGCGAEQVQAAVTGLPVDIVPNPDWAAGQSTSVRAALAALPAGIEAALFLLADQPGITAELLNTLIQRRRETLAPIVLPSFQGRRGNPVLFERSLFAELAQVTGDTGGRSVIARHATQVVQVEWPESALLDIDTATEYDIIRSYAVARN